MNRPPTVAIYAVIPDELEVGLDDEDLPVDVVVRDEDTADLRAEHNEDGDGRNYTVTALVTDEQGNSTLIPAKVFGPHDQHDN